MPFEQRDNSGALFVNDKGDNPSRPDRRGQAKIGGVEYWVSAWIREKEGKKWLSLAFTSKEDARKLREAAGGQEAIPEMNDEIPF